MPLYSSKGQRCCKHKMESPSENKTPADAVPQGGRVLQGERGGGEVGGNALPGVLRTQSRRAVGEQEVSCLPSFVIAGTQKSGTTALTGKRRGEGRVVILVTTVGVAVVSAV